MSRRPGSIFLPILLLVVCAGSAAQPQNQPPERTAIDRYCAGCHNNQTKAGGLTLDTISADGVDRHSAVWEKVVRRLRVRSMPPEGAPRPDEPLYKALLSS